MSIEVVLANYNQGHLISRAVSNLNKQTIPPKKIVIIDDGSTDNSVLVIKGLIQKYKNIKLLRNSENLGATFCYNFGLSNVQSEFVYFAAADDQTYPLLFEISIAFLRFFPQAPFSCSEAIVCEEFSNRSNRRPIARPQQYSGFLSPKKVIKIFKYTDNWILTGTCIYRTDMFRSYKPAKPLLEGFSDSILAKRIAMTEGCVFIRYVGVKWNVSDQGLSRGMFKNLQKFTLIKMALKNEIFASEEFPRWYWRKFSSRLDFIYYRFKVDKLSYSPINECSNKCNPLKRILLNNINLRGKFYRNIITLGLFIKYRPYSILYLINTFLHRKFE
jgi:glycosyltransferase involved in cell wall biosynthesis